MTKSLFLILASTWLGAGGCASWGDDARPLSVVEHEEVAFREQVEAERHERRAENARAGTASGAKALLDPCVPGHPGDCAGLAATPADAERDAVAIHLARAEKHHAAAQRLRVAEQRACRGIDRVDREEGPLLGRHELRAVEEFGLSGGTGPAAAPAGIVITIAASPGFTAAELRKVIACHVAHNAAMGFESRDHAACPLNVRGVQTDVRAVPAGLRLEITSTDAPAALEIARRGRSLRVARPRVGSSGQVRAAVGDSPPSRACGRRC